MGMLPKGQVDADLGGRPEAVNQITFPARIYSGSLRVFLLEALWLGRFLTELEARFIGRY